MEKRIVFITEMRDPSHNASSTQIMTRNILCGFRDLAEEVILVAVLNKDTNENNVENYYSELADTIIYTYAVTKGGGRIRNTVSMMSRCLYSKFESYEAILNIINCQTILVSQSPSIDTALLCKLIVKQKSPKKYVQYWGDPLALSLITPKEFRLNRLPAFLVEHHLHQFADSIVYGTRPLYVAQRELFRNTKDIKKFAYADVSYKPNNSYVRTNQNLVFGYLGNYYSKIRDIKPLYDSFCLDSNAQLVIYGQSDLALIERDNISIHNRVSQEEIEQIEKRIDVDICILNRIGTQIPGKLFYQTDTKKIIWVIIDGPESDAIVEYLREFGRFVFSENNTQSIINTLDIIKHNQYDSGRSVRDLLSPASVCKCIIDGGYK